jgi:hypothetical protein
MGSLRSHNPMGLHGLLREYLYFLNQERKVRDNMRRNMRLLVANGERRRVKNVP